MPPPPLVLLHSPSRSYRVFRVLSPVFFYPHRHVFFVVSQASLNIDDPTLKALIESLPEAPAMAQRQCLEMCALENDDGDFSLNFDN